MGIQRNRRKRAKRKAIKGMRLFLQPLKRPRPKLHQISICDVRHFITHPEIANRWKVLMVLHAMNQSNMEMILALDQQPHRFDAQMQWEEEGQTSTYQFDGNRP